MSNLVLKCWNWCRRFRKRCGYGVHSPSDFFLITFVIYEKLPFYAYERLSMYRKSCHLSPEHREKTDKLLFRLVNHLQPEMMIEAGTGTGVSTLYLAEGNKKMKAVTYADVKTDVRNESFGCRTDIDYRQGGAKEMISFIKETGNIPDLIHISHTDDYESVFESFLPYVSSKTCMIISLPYSDKKKKEWWKKVITDGRTGVTFDLYDIGLVFFDSKRVKEHRIVNFL